MSADLKRQILQRVGEFLREIGILVIVFAPLESLVSYGTLTPRERLVIVVIVVPCLGIGTYLGLEP